MPNPWDLPQTYKYKQGDERPDGIFLAVGRALTKWEALEAQMGYLFALFACLPFDDRNYPPVMRAFGAVQSSITRADMIGHAGEAFFLSFDR
jgi:hypothetical protein